MTNQDKTNIYECEKCGETVRRYMGEIHECHTTPKSEWESERIEEAVKERDEFWKKQEMGVATDCQKHCEEAVRKEREKIITEIRQVANKHTDNDFLYNELRALEERVALNNKDKEV